MQNQDIVQKKKKTKKIQSNNQQEENKDQKIQPETEQKVITETKKSQQQKQQSAPQKEQEKLNEEIPNQLLLPEDIEDKRKIIVVLEKCPLETARLKRKIVLLNSDEHKNYINNKLKKDYSIYRPDIIHHSMLALMDSPLNKAGHLQVFIHTEQGVLITISPNTKIPRTYQRFAALIAQLLTKLKIRAVQTSETLLKVIKNPITNHLPENCIKIGTSSKARLVNLKEYAQKKIPKNAPIVFVVGGVSKGNPGMEVDYTDDCICISKYSLSAGCCLSRITHTFEELWNII